MRALILLPALLSSGCVFGYVRDATNDAPIANATVWTIGACSGDKCTTPSDGVAVTDNTGVFKFSPPPCDVSADAALRLPRPRDVSLRGSDG